MANSKLACTRPESDGRRCVECWTIFLRKWSKERNTTERVIIGRWAFWRVLDWKPSFWGSEQCVSLFQIYHGVTQLMMLADTYQLIAKVDLWFPATMSADARDLVSKVSTAISVWLLRMNLLAPSWTSQSRETLSSDQCTQAPLDCEIPSIRHINLWSASCFPWSRFLDNLQYVLCHDASLSRLIAAQSLDVTPCEFVSIFSFCDTCYVRKSQRN